MKYVVVSPNNKMICFDHADQVAQYCSEQATVGLDNFCKDQELAYENMTPVEIGYAYSLVGAENGGCRIFETSDVIAEMVSLGVDTDTIVATNDLFNDRRLNQEISLNGYLADVFSEMVPIDVDAMLTGLYRCNNIGNIFPPGE